MPADRQCEIIDTEAPVDGTDRCAEPRKEALEHVVATASDAIQRAHTTDRPEHRAGHRGPVVVGSLHVGSLLKDDEAVVNRPRAPSQHDVEANAFELTPRKTRDKLTFAYSSHPLRKQKSGV